MNSRPAQYRFSNVPAGSRRDRYLPNMKVEALTDRRVEAAAVLLANAHGAASAGPVARVCDVSRAVEAVGEGLRAGRGWAATADGAVVGFLLVGVPRPDGSSRGGANDFQHAARPEGCRETYRALYEAAAGWLVRYGKLHHQIRVLARPEEPVRAFFELGFGMDQIKGVRPIEAGLPDFEGCLVEPAGPGDTQAMVELWIELSRFHARSPVLEAGFLSVHAIRDELVKTLADDTRQLFVAREAGAPVGFMEIHPNGAYPDTVTIGLNVVTEKLRSRGVGTAMLAAALQWASERGNRYCSVGWASANPVSDAFYRSRGFVPFRYDLARILDSRITWANENLDYSAIMGREDQ